MDELILITFALIGSFSTHCLIRYQKWHGVKASSFLSLLTALICRFLILEQTYLVETLPIIFIGATFIGMVSFKQTSSFVGIAAATLIYCILFFYSSTYFQGYGGVLGTTACVSLLVVLSTRYFSSDKKLRVGVRKIEKKVKKSTYYFSKRKRN